MPATSEVETGLPRTVRIGRSRRAQLLAAITEAAEPLTITELAALVRPRWRTKLATTWRRVLTVSEALEVLGSVRIDRCCHPMRIAATGVPLVEVRVPRRRAHVVARKHRARVMPPQRALSAERVRALVAPITDRAIAVRLVLSLAERKQWQGTAELANAVRGCMAFRGLSKQALHRAVADLAVALSAQGIASAKGMNGHRAFSANGSSAHLLRPRCSLHFLLHQL